MQCVHRWVVFFYITYKGEYKFPEILKYFEVQLQINMIFDTKKKVKNKVT